MKKTKHVCEQFSHIVLVSPTAMFFMYVTSAVGEELLYYEQYTLIIPFAFTVRTLLKTCFFSSVHALAAFKMNKLKIKLIGRDNETH
jgi:hypothetical protein